MPRLLLTLAALALLAAPAPAQQQKKKTAHFAGMTVHVFLAKSGRFSRPISQIQNFTTWNFSVSGTGIPQGERFNTVLLRIALRADGEVFAAGTQAVVTITERGANRPRRWRLNLKDIYVPPGGRVFHVAVIREIGCLPLDITVRSHARTWKKSYPFRCGE